MIFPELFIPAKERLNPEEPFTGQNAALATNDKAEETLEKLHADTHATLAGSPSADSHHSDATEDSVSKDYASMIMLLLSVLAGALLLILTEI